MAQVGLLRGFGLQGRGFWRTQGLLCSSFLGLLWFLASNSNILPKKELHRRVWVGRALGLGANR